jgi:hypothetical protein
MPRHFCELKTALRRYTQKAEAFWCPKNHRCDFYDILIFKEEVLRRFQ